MTTISIWENFSKHLKNFIRQRAKSEADTDDILQEVFLKVHKNLHQLMRTDKLESWLFQITRNVISDFYKKQGKELKIRTLAPVESVESWDFDKIKNLNFMANGMGKILENYEEMTGKKIEGSTAEEAIDFFKILCPFLEEIDPKYGEAVYYADYLGMSQKDIAKMLNISLSGAKSRVQRGREHLKKVFFKCCDFEFDARGSVINFERKNPNCLNC